MHFENLPPWALPLLAATLAVFVISLVASLVLTRRRRRERRKRWRESRARSLGHAWAWDWVMRRGRTRMLTDQRSEPNG